MKMAFKSLVSAVSEQCQEIKQALRRFSYFETWDANAVEECCRLGSVVEFLPDAVILGSEIGNAHTVHFILEGVCKMIHHLQVQPRRGKINKPPRSAAEKTVDSESAKRDFASHLFRRKIYFETDPASDTVLSASDEKKIIIPDTSKCDNEEAEPEKITEANVEVKPMRNRVAEVNQKEGAHGPDHHIKVLEECRERWKKTIKLNKRDAVHGKNASAKSFFVQTVFLFKGACFGLEKCDSGTFLVSATRVKCLQIPRRFLLRHNPCIIWNRIRLFYSLYLPGDKVIFDCLNSDRKWKERKRRETERIVSFKKIPNYTSVTDVPLSIRLTEVQPNEGLQ